MSSPQCSNEVGTPGSSEMFQELLQRLRDCHDHTIQELQLKVNKLKKERCFDAQRLEEFYKKNQQLRDQQRTLQESIKVLKERLQSGPCDRCKETEKQLKKNQAPFEHLLINELQSEKNLLKEEIRKLRLLREQSHGQISHQTSFSEPEEGVIPDSPKQPLSFPVVNKMKRKRDQSNIRYAEKRPSPPLPDPQRRTLGYAGAVLVPETCDLDVTFIPKSDTKRHGRTVVPESCRLDLNSQQMSESDDEDEGKEKARNFTSCPEAEEQNAEKNRDRPESSQRPPKHPEQESSGRRSWEKDRTMNEAPRTSPPSPNSKSSSLSQNLSPNDESWSMDPGAALSQYNTNAPPHPQPIIIQAETVDLDCTYVSHSLLVAHQRQTQLKQTNCTTGIGQKANDSLAHIFDTTGHEEYESCPQSCLMGEENEEEEECEEQDMGRGDEVTEEAKCLDEVHPDGDAGESARDRSVAHVVVVRKKAERRKLHGHTCKECEIYYADLPEDERRKKLSSCSRHRYRYIPPSTPENFWDVGFPSTQTCVERGYIKEDNQVDPRSRRRRPYHAMFSPKAL
ncbi:DNA endonuclease RBBP8 isoform X2 [Silurus meridionalis]|nr:DNA endonuclease RBBP8 isoform X2 [Silurus meridionalis]